jgi:hypothetical protein
MTGNTLTTTGTGQGVATATVSNGATILNGRVNITGSASNTALNVNTGSAATNTVELNGGTLATNGAASLRVAPSAISSTSNNIAISGVNSITMAGTAPAISGVNSLTITNTTAATPLRITNSGDNPSVILEATTGSDLIPVEFTITNGLIVSALGNQRSATRGCFWFVNGADAVQISNANRRVAQN